MSVVKFGSQNFNLQYVLEYLTSKEQVQQAVTQMQMGLTPMVMVDEDRNVLGGEPYLLAAMALGRKTLAFTVYPYRSEDQKLFLVRLFHLAEKVNASSEVTDETSQVYPVSQAEFLAWAKQSRSRSQGVSDHRLCVITSNITELEKACDALAKVQETDLPDKKISLKNLLCRVRKQQVQVMSLCPPAPVRRGNVQLYCGEFQTQGQNIIDGSVDLIPTDPPYSRDSLKLWEDLGQFAWKKLKPTGLLIAYNGKEYLPEVHDVLRKSGLIYLWECAIIHSGGADTCWGARIKCGWKPILIYMKPPVVKGWKPFLDICTGGREKTHHPWQQAVSEMQYYLQALAPQRKCLIVDPFLGSGSTIIAARNLGMDAIGIEKDPVTFETAKKRIEDHLAHLEHKTNEKEGA